MSIASVQFTTKDTKDTKVRLRWISFVSIVSIVVTPRRSLAFLDEHDLHPPAGGRALHVDEAVLLAADHHEFLASGERCESLAHVRSVRHQPHVLDLRRARVAFAEHGARVC